jgi:hypothetical protein
LEVQRRNEDNGNGEGVDGIQASAGE